MSDVSTTLPVPGEILKLTSKEEKRFWSKVEKSEGCWLWKGSISTDGYCAFWLRGNNRRANRVALAMLIPIPEEKQACHKCDNPLCVRGDHLFVGTQQENIADKVSKARQHSMPGEDHPMAILTDSIVREIRSRVAAGELQKAIAAEIGIGSSHVSAIVRRKIWCHVS